MRAHVPTIAALLTVACDVDPASPVVPPLAVASAAVAVSTPYTAIDITPPGAAGGFGLGINDHGATAMLIDFIPGRRAGFLRRADGSFVDVGQLPGGIGNTWATGINNENQVVGFSQTTRFVHAYVWSQSKGMRDLGTLGGQSSEANAINNRGQVVGASDIRSESFAPRHAFLWSPLTRQMQDLGTLGANQSSRALNINDLGEVVGESGGHAFLWTSAGGMIDLGTGAGFGSIATGINDRGAVVGALFFPFQVIHGFLWTRAGGLVDLGTFGAETGGAVTDINERGLMVGYALGRAFVRSAAGSISYLPDLGAGGASARQVNECGQAVGDAYGPAGVLLHPVLWTKRC